MKIGADTNVFLRAAVRDDPQQAVSAVHLLRTAELVAVPVAALCEFAWTMRSLY
jgi:predicted nucleic acid-binding protein